MTPTAIATAQVVGVIVLSLLITAAALYLIIRGADTIDPDS